MDIAVYGAGIFTPTLLAAMHLAGGDAGYIAQHRAAVSGLLAVRVMPIRRAPLMGDGLPETQFG